MTAWMQDAGCRGLPTDDFVSPGAGRPALDADEIGPKAVCAICPVRAECLAYAMADLQLVGIWGGTTEQERREMRRRRKGKVA